MNLPYKDIDRILQSKCNHARKLTIVLFIWLLRNFVIEGVACQLPEETASHSSITNFLTGYTVIYLTKVLILNDKSWPESRG